MANGLAKGRLPKHVLKQQKSQSLRGAAKRDVPWLWLLAARQTSKADGEAKDGVAV